MTNRYYMKRIRCVNTRYGLDPRRLLANPELLGKHLRSSQKVLQTKLVCWMFRVHPLRYCPLHYCP